MEAKAYIKYNQLEDKYKVNSPELEPYEISGDSYDLISAVEDFIDEIKYTLECFEKYGHDDNMPDERELYNLQLHFIINCKNTKEELLYVKAVNIMLRQHHGQKDKAGKDYYFHPVRVSEKCIETDTKIVALLHDTVEDTGLTFENLIQAKFPQNIVDGIDAVTRKDGESYAGFIERSSYDKIGCKVKIHDLQDNMDITRLSNLTEKDLYRLNKYLHSWRFLKGLENDTSLIVE